MDTKIEKIDAFFAKLNRWQSALSLLRKIVRKTELRETLKWYQPCYTLDDKNVVIISSFKDYCIIGFFKGALLDDTHGLLTQPGNHTQYGRQMRFTGEQQIKAQEATILSYLLKAIEIEKSGTKPLYKSTDEYPMPDELQQAFKYDANFKKAFESLTPGRQRGYLLHFTQPKQSATRMSRIEKCKPSIFAGKGLNDRPS